MKLGFIGCGKMATALIQGVLKAGLCRAKDITVSDILAPAAQKLAKELGVTAAAGNADVVRASDVIVLAVKPDDALAAVRALASRRVPAKPGRRAGGGRGKLLISIVAGLPIRELEKAAAGKFRVIRVMPNTPALVGASASAFATGKGATAADAQLAQKLFSSVGLAFPVKENLLDAVTGLSGSGPAYACLMIEALSDGGVAAGLPRDIATRLAAQTLLGTARMVLETGLHPGALKDMVTSPGGTTIEGMHELEKGKVRAALMSAVRAASEKSKKLGQ